MSAFLDTFTGAANDDLVTVHDGTHWAAYSISSAKLSASATLVPSASSGLGATLYYKGTTPVTLGTDYYVQCKYVAGNYPALYVGFQKTTENGYLLFNTGDLYKVVSGATGSLLQNVGAFSAGDTMYLQKTESGGTVTVTCKKNGSTVGTPQVDSSSPHLGGASAILFYGGGGEIDDYQTDNVGGAGGFFGSPVMVTLAGAGSF